MVYAACVASPSPPTPTVGAGSSQREDSPATTSPCAYRALRRWRPHGLCSDVVCRVAVLERNAKIPPPVPLPPPCPYLATPPASRPSPCQPLTIPPPSPYHRRTIAAAPWYSAENSVGAAALVLRMYGAYTAQVRRSTGEVGAGIRGGMVYTYGGRGARTRIWGTGICSDVARRVAFKESASRLRTPHRIYGVPHRNY